jgi:D-3-phosphoglycerate dehydrogenase
MTDAVDDLVLDLLEWLATADRPYSEVLEAWRTSCPRLPVWEEANERGFIERLSVPGEGSSVRASNEGVAFLRSRRPGVVAAMRH